MSNNSTVSTSNTLSPFDLTGIGMGFGLYRPRRPSYTFATRCSRHRSESYRYATRREHVDSASEISNGEDFIEGVLRNKARKISYLKATKQDEAEASPSSSPRVGMVFCGNNVFPAKTELDNSIREQIESPVETPDDTEEQVTTYTPVDHQYSGDENSTNENQNYISHDCSAHATTNNISSPSQSKPPQGSERQQRLSQQRSLSQDRSRRLRVVSVISFNKNLIVLCLSFILVFSSFRAIQNLQSSMHTTDNLGILTMMMVHVSMVFACLVAPIIINIFRAKWALCIGILCFLIWFGANFHPTFYTLIPTSLFVGFGQGILWNAETSYILKLAFDSAKATKGHLEREMFRFQGIFLACFQTTHIWGNLVSSLLLTQRANEISPSQDLSGTAGLDYPHYDDFTNFSSDQSLVKSDVGESPPPMSHCGALHRCRSSVGTIFPGVIQEPSVLSTVLWKLMTSYMILGVVSFGIIVLLLDRIGARADPEKTPKEIILQHLGQLAKHKTLKLLVPLLLFNGMQQGFIFSDYNQYFVTCTLGINYVGYCMITLGISNVLGAFFVALFSHKIPREVVLGFGGIVHISLMIGYLIWIPENKPFLFFVLAAAWGLCDSVWQTQCKTLICLTCIDAPEVAFTNYRLVQSIGLAVMFGCGTWMCVSAKLYLLMTLLVVAIMFYVLAEYRLRHDDDDDVFDDP